MASMKNIGQMPRAQDETPPAPVGMEAPVESPMEVDAEQGEYDQMLQDFVGNMREGVFGGDTPDGQTSSVVQALLAPGPEGVTVDKVAEAAAQVTLLTWGAGASQGVDIPLEVAMGALLVSVEDMMQASAQTWDGNEQGQIRNISMRRFQEGALEQGLVSPNELESIMDQMQENPEELDQALMEIDPEGAQVLTQEAQNMSIPGRGAMEQEMMAEVPAGPSMGAVQ